MKGHNVFRDNERTSLTGLEGAYRRALLKYSVVRETGLASRKGKMGRKSGTELDGFLICEIHSFTSLLMHSVLQGRCCTHYTNVKHCVQREEMTL